MPFPATPAPGWVQLSSGMCCCGLSGPGHACNSHGNSLVWVSGLQESTLKNVKLAAQARGVLASYHPLWLRLGAEVVVGRTMAGGLPPHPSPFISGHQPPPPLMTLLGAESQSCHTEG
jgi:hypothetical protein